MTRRLRLLQAVRRWPRDGGTLPGASCWTPFLFICSYVECADQALASRGRSALLAGRGILRLLLRADEPRVRKAWGWRNGFLFLALP